MRYVLSIIGMIVSFFLIKYREKVADSFGESEWAQKVGGSANVVIIVALFIFFWSIAEITGTNEILFAPLIRILSFGRAGGGATPDF